MSELTGQSGLALPLPYGRVVPITDVDVGPIANCAAYAASLCRLCEAMALRAIQPDHSRRHFAKVVTALVHGAMLPLAGGPDVAAEKRPVFGPFCCLWTRNSTLG